MSRLLLILTLLTALTWAAGPVAAEHEPGPQRTVYVPVYSHVFSGNKAHPFYLAATLAIRNIDPKHSVTIRSADYFDSDGTLVRRHLPEPVTLPPMGSHFLFIREHDKTGGPGASFLIRWSGNAAINHPLIEAILIGSSGGQGISFICPGREIRDPEK
jgi:hypothetical protein